MTTNSSSHRHAWGNYGIQPCPCRAHTPSILKKAFEDRLVEQNPEDEPALVLLERIKAKKSRQL